MAAKSEGKCFAVTTPYGTFKIELFDDTPLHRDNFTKLVEEEFYNGTTFHRVVPGYVIQGGDPNSRDRSKRELHGQGGPGYTLPAEIKHSNIRSTVAAARKPDSENPRRESSGCQFFINLNDNRFYDGNYTVFGRVIEGMEIVDKISQVRRDALDNPQEAVTIEIEPVE
ncbi:MAG: peptidylprolyl isomerase [Chlorobiales bacterium]|nr:peptidylprolyl isomerase [Chlorobiales bacterium]